MVATPSLESRGTCTLQSAFGNATEITVFLISSASVFSWKEASPKRIFKKYESLFLAQSFGDGHMLLCCTGQHAPSPHLMQFDLSG